MHQQQRLGVCQNCKQVRNEGLNGKRAGPVSYKSRLKRKPKFLTGISQAELNLATVDKNTFLFVSHFNPNTQCEDIVQFLKRKNNAVYIVQKVQSRYPQPRQEYQQHTFTKTYFYQISGQKMFFTRYINRGRMNNEDLIKLGMCLENIWGPRQSTVNFLHRNIESLSNKIAQVENVTSDLDIDFLCLTEHWMTGDEVRKNSINDYH